MKIYRANIELCLFLNVNLTVIFLFLFSKLGIVLMSTNWV